MPRGELMARFVFHDYIMTHKLSLACLFKDMLSVVESLRNLGHRSCAGPLIPQGADVEDKL